MSSPPSGYQMPASEINPSSEPARTGKNARKREARRAAAQALEASRSNLSAVVNLSDVEDTEVGKDAQVDKVVRFDLSSAVVHEKQYKLKDTNGRRARPQKQAQEEAQNSDNDTDGNWKDDYFPIDEEMQMDFMPRFKRDDSPVYDYSLYNPSTSSIQVQYLTPRPIAPPMVAPVQPRIFYQPHISDIDRQNAIYNL